MMKVAVLVVLLLTFLSLSAQESITVDIPYDKTVALIFPAPIDKHILSTEDIGMRIDGSNCYLQADLEAFAEASLFIQLENQAYYSFVLQYNNDTDILVKPLSMDDAIGIADGQDKRPMISSGSRLFEPEISVQKASYKGSISELAKQVLTKNDIKTEGAISSKIVLTMDAIYAEGNHLFLKISLENNSNIPYKLESVNFFITGRQKLLKKTAIVDEEQSPVFILNERIKEVKAKSALSRVYVFRRFSLSRDFALQIDVIEQEGKRDLQLVVDNKVFDQAKGFRVE